MANPPPQRPYNPQFIHPNINTIVHVHIKNKKNSVFNIMDHIIIMITVINIS